MDNETLQKIPCVMGEIPAVSAGIGNELFLIQSLRAIQRLLCGVSEQTVGIPLEGGQIIQLGRLFRSCFLIHRFHNGSIQVTGFLQRFRFFFIRDALAIGIEPAAKLQVMFSTFGRFMRRFRMFSCFSVLTWASYFHSTGTMGRSSARQVL